jgi:hypothetical protein
MIELSYLIGLSVSIDKALSDIFVFDKYLLSLYNLLVNYKSSLIVTELSYLIGFNVSIYNALSVILAFYK